MLLLNIFTEPMTISVLEYLGKTKEERENKWNQLKEEKIDGR